MSYNECKNKKIYAVREGRKCGIFYKWKDCKKSIDGFSGAKFKSFESIRDAWKYLYGSDYYKEQKESKKPKVIVAYVGGWFIADKGRYSYCCILISKDGKKIKKHNFGKSEYALQLGHLAGVLKATLTAVNWAVDNGLDKIIIKHNNHDIPNLFEGNLQPENEFSEKCIESMKILNEKISISFKIAVDDNEAQEIARYELEVLRDSDLT